MANVKVSELTAATTLDEDDLLCSVDTSDSETKKITYSNFLRTVPDGTAAAPSIANTGDGDTGILFPSDNTVAISCGGTQRFSVDGSGNVSISGTLTVSGSTTTIESTTLTVDDKNIELGSVASPSNTTADGGGITLKGATDKEIKWVNSTGYWTFNTGIEVGGHLQIDDSNEIRVGTGMDLRIYHDGTDSYIDDAGTGNLRLNGNEVHILSNDNSEYSGRFISNGAVELYHDGNKKLETNGGGVDISGEVRCDTLDLDGSGDVEGSLTVNGGVTLNANLDLQDNDKILLGSGDDLEIYHDGSNSYIDDTGTGNLQIRGSSQVKIQKYTGENMFVGIADGAASMYYDNSQKIATKSDGVDVTGEVQCDSLDVDGAADITGEVNLHNNLSLQDDDKINLGGGDDLQIYHDGDNSYIDEAGTGELRIRVAGTSGSGFYKYASNEKLATFEPDGAVTLYHNNVAKLATKSDGVNVEGELQCDSLDVDGAGDISGSLTVDSGTLFVDSSNNRVGVGTTSPSNNLEISSSTGGIIRLTDSGGGYALLEAGDGNVAIQADVGNTEANSKIQFFVDNSEKGRIDNSGNLAIGHTSADGRLHVRKDGTGETLQIWQSDLGTNNRNFQLKSPSSDSATEPFTFSTGNSFAVEIDSSEAFRIDSSGRSLLGTTTEGHVDADDFTVASSGNTGITIRSGTSSGGNIFFSDGTSGTAEYDGYIIYRHDDRALRFATAATERLRINTNGAWGIEGASNYGTSGQVLTSNGNDSPTWQDAASVSVGGANSISMNDSVQITFGASNDLQIFHNGSNSEIVNNTGDLVLKNNTNDADVLLQTDDGSGGVTNYLRCDGSTGDVVLYQYGSQKLQTFSSGVDITGELQCDSLDVDGGGDINGQLDVNRIVVRDNGSGSPLFAIRADDDAPWAFNLGNDSYSSSHQHGLRMYQQADGSIRVRNSGNSAWEEFRFEQQNGGSTNTGILLTTSREVKLYYQGSNKLVTKSDGVDIIGELQCDSLDVDGAANVAGDIDIDGDIRHNGDTNCKFGFPANDTFRVSTSGTERFRITSTGAIAIEGASNYGTSGQVLTSNGNDAPTWQDAGGDGYTAYAFATTERNGSITSSQGFASCTRNGTGSYTLTFSTAVGSTAYTVVIGNEDGDNNYLRRSTKASASISYTSRSTGDQARDMRQGVVVFKQ